MLSHEKARAVSRIGKFASNVNIGKGDVLIALRAYLDSSGKLEDDWMTLVAVAATDDVWDVLEKGWDEILANHTPKGSYIHMREVYRLEKAFDKSMGWNHDNAFGLVNECVAFISTAPKDKLRVFYCSVDLAAWAKLRAETYQMPDPIDMCNTFCSEAVLMWYGFGFAPSTLMDPRSDSVKYFFDRNEYFFQPFYEKWNRERNQSDATGRWSLWNAIDEVAPVDMKKTPGIQAADIVAWARNRETFTADGEIYSKMAYILRDVTPTSYVIWNEEKLRKQYKPLIHLP